MQMWLPFLFLLSVALAAGDGLVNLLVHQVSRDVEVTCTLSDSCSGQNISQVVTLTLSRSTDTGDSVLALINSSNKTNPNSYLQDSTVSGSICDGVRTSSFLALRFKSDRLSATETFTCEAYVFGSDNLPMILKASEHISISKEVGPKLTADPSVLQLGLTESLTLTCAMDDPASANITTPMSLSLLRIHDATEQLLAKVTASGPATLMPGAVGASVQGQIGPGQNNSSLHLEITWSNPEEQLTGEYICEVMGVDSDVNPLWLKGSVNVTAIEPSREQFIHRIKAQATQLNQLSSQLQQLSQEFQQFKQNTSLLPRGVASCGDLNLKSGSVVVTLDPLDDKGQVDALCQYTPDGSAWTVFQNRFDGSVDFFRDFNDYENGFGNISGEFWMGLKILRRLVQSGEYELQVDMVSNNGTSYTRNYPNFSIGPAPGYQLNVTGYDDGRLGLSYNSGLNFSTFDRFYNELDCASLLHGAFWYNHPYCSNVNLNGKWGTADMRGMAWQEIFNLTQGWMEESTMKIRLKS